MTSSESTNKDTSSWLDTPLLEKIHLNWEIIIFALIVLLAVSSRFYELGLRVMSHDESLHTYYSWKLYRGEGYQHTPMMHGPLQFHLIAFSYFLFGDSDFTARLPHAIASILSVIFLWNFRRYLGKIGTLVAAGLFVISPYLLYYGRYARNEAFVALFGLMTLWAVLRYFESGEQRYLYWLTAATVLHFSVKETSFIYTAQLLLFLGFFFLNRILRQNWQYRKLFVIFLILTVFLFGGALGAKIITGQAAPAASGEGVISPAVPNQPVAAAASAIPNTALLALIALGGAAFLAALYFLLRGYTMARLREERSFGMMLLVFTLVLPHLVAFPVSLMGWSPTDYSAQGLTHTAIFLVPIGLISIGIGLWWNWKVWLRCAAIFYSIFIVFYSTIFTNGAGFFTGMVGSLGYWIEQQGVQRGSQPWYYYLLVQVPMYEYLPFIGAIFATLYFFLQGKPEEVELPQTRQLSSENIDEKAPAIPLLIFWWITSFAAFSYAGEKMPWLTVHITLGMVLLTGWGIGQVIEKFDWSAWKEHQGWVTIGVLLVFLLSLPTVVFAWLGPNPPFQGKELGQLQTSSLFLTALFTVLISGWGLWRLSKKWMPEDFTRLLGLIVFGGLAILTVRSSVLANYINYDQANEYLVYAHSARGVKDVLSQVQNLSFRTTDGLAIQVGYDDDTSWPMTWYLRNFINQRYYGNTPGKELREIPAIIVGDNNYGKMEPIVAKSFYRFDYIRMIWPNQDYFNLDWNRLKNAVTNPQVRAAIFDIWLNHDFKAYGIATNQDTAINNWNPADRMRLYLRKDVVSKIWEYGAVPSKEETTVDPYEKNHLTLAADRVIGVNGKEPGQFQAPRSVAIAKDGSFFVADSGNHRIQHLDPEGKVIKVWGSYGEGQNATNGTFNEPWSIAIGPDGSVFVADTWNHRIQKFTPNGEFIKTWGRFGQAESHESFWGPRDVTIDAKGRVFITDTGNKRIVVFDTDGKYITEFGGAGMEPGKFDEPVGVRIDSEGRVYVTDAWNQRIQSFTESSPNVFTPLKQWEVSAWYGQSLDNKPYLTIDEKNNIYISDPEAYRIIEFTPDGQYVRSWGDFGNSMDTFGITNGLTADKKGGIWLSDAGNHRLIHFTLP